MGYLQKINLFWSYLLSADFLKNFMALLSSSVLKQIIGFIALPLLARFYTPNAFGLLELFLAIAGLIATIASFRFELMIGLAKNHKEANNVLMLCFVFNILFTIFSLVGAIVAIVIFGEEPIYLILPIYVFMFAFSQSLTYYQLNFENYKNVAKFRTYKVLFIQSTCFAMIFCNLNYGLILGYTIGESLAALAILQMSVRYFSISDVSLSDIWKAFRSGLKISSTMFISHFIGAAALRVPAFFIPLIGSTEILGYYSICRQILTAPTLIAENIGVIYRQKAIEEWKNRGAFTHCFLLYLAKVSIVALPIFSFIFVFPSFIFDIVMGHYPPEIISYFQVLSLGTLFLFISTPLDKGAVIVNAKGYILSWHLIRLLALYGFSIIYYKTCYNTLYYIWGFTFINIILYVYDMIYEYHLSKERIQNDYKMV